MIYGDEASSLLEAETNPLYSAVLTDNLPEVRRLLDDGADVSLTFGRRKYTVLHHAVYNSGVNNSRPDEPFPNTYEICELLLKSGADCNDARNYEKVTPLCLALSHSNVKVVRLMLDHGGDITAVDEMGNTALHIAASHGNLEVIQFALNQGLDVKVTDNSGRSALQKAVNCLNVEACELLLKNGAMVDGKKYEGSETPMTVLLDRAFSYSPYGSENVVLSMVRILQLFLDYGANVFDVIPRGTVLELAARNGRNELCNEGIRNTLIEHVARMEYLNGLKVSEHDQKTIENNRFYKKHYQSCLREIRSMEETEFYHDLTVSVLFKSEKLLSGYARNDKLIEALDGNEYKNKFPIYFASLKKKFDLVVEKQRTLDHAAGVLSSIFNLNDSIHPVTQMIMHFLDDKDFELLRM